MLLPDLANAPDLAERFVREIKVQASLEHPNNVLPWVHLRRIGVEHRVDRVATVQRHER